MCISCAKLAPLPDDSIPDPRLTIQSVPKTTRRSVLELSWPKQEIFELDVDIEGHDNIAEGVVNLLRDMETEPGPTQTPGGPDDTPSEESRRDYKYDPLELSESPDLRKHKFRLLRISNTPEGPVHGTLESYTIGQAPEYEALSYTWSGGPEEPADGNGHRGRPLFLGENFRRLAVTKNCEAALKILRQRKKELVWIDAICINQRDVAEKTYQVGLMHYIYASAKKVLVYLGPFLKVDLEDLALNLLGKDPKEFDGRLNDEHCVQALRHLFSKPYFSRIWVVQEVVLAKTAMVFCGNKQIQWHDIQSKCDKKTGDLGRINMPTWIQNIGRVKNIIRPYDLGDWIFSGMGSHASDARDKVFAFFGMAEDPVGWGLSANYNLSVEQVYTGMAAYLISEGRVWDILNRAVCDRKDESDDIHLDLPSWVPDFRHAAPVPLQHWLAEINPEFQPRLQSRLDTPARPARVLQKTGSLVISGHRLLNLPRVKQLPDGRYLLEAPREEFRFLLQAPFLKKDHIFFPRRQDSSKTRSSGHLAGGTVFPRPLDDSRVLLHVRDTDSPYAFTLIGRCIFQMDRAQLPALSFPGNSIADDVLPLTEHDFNILWTVYQYLMSVRSNFAVLRSSMLVIEQNLNDSKTAWRDYETLRASPPGDLQMTGLRYITAFRGFWEDDQSYRVETWSNWAMVGRLAAWVDTFENIHPTYQREVYLDLFKRWETSAAGARSATQQFLDEIQDPQAENREDAVRQIKSWKDSTLKLLEYICYEQYFVYPGSLPDVNFESYLYPTPEHDRRYEPITADYPLEDGFIMYLHKINRRFYFPARIGGLRDLEDAKQMFDGICHTLESGGENLKKFCRQPERKSQDWVQALLGNWTHVQDWLRLFEALGKMTDQERSAFKEVRGLQEDLCRRGKLRSRLGLGTGKEETLVII
jgi:hypothetical protein